MPKATILMIDDDKTLTDVYRTSFEKEGYAVSVCYNGKEGLDALWKGLRPDVIILDVMMPVMDGTTFLREASYKFNLPPVIVMSSEEEDSKKLDALMHGAHVHLSKVRVTPKDMLAEIKKLLKAKAAAQ